MLIISIRDGIEGEFTTSENVMFSETIRGQFEINTKKQAKYKVKRLEEGGRTTLYYKI